MKIKNYSVVFGIVIIFALLAFFTAMTPKASGQQAKEEILNKMVLREGMNRTQKQSMMEKLAEKIVSDNEELAKHFKSRNFKAMADLYGKRGAVIISPEYEKISGKDSTKFWKKLWKADAKVEIKIVSIYLSDAIGEKPAQEMKYDTVAFVVHEFHIVPKEEVPSNLTVNVSLKYIHQTNCFWEP
jgi:hypothetical protein